MYFEPKLDTKNPGFDWIVNELTKKNPFYFLKLNHGFWERLVQIENLGFQLEDIDSLSSNQIADIEKKIRVEGVCFFAGGFLSDLLRLFREYRPKSHTFIFVSSLQPWPLSDRVEGTPLQSSTQCLELISKHVSADLIEHSSNEGFTGYEFKKALIDNELSRFFHAIRHRKVIVLCNQRNREIFDHVEIENLAFFIVHERQARLERHQLLADVGREISQCEAEPSVVISMIGGALATWLGFKLHEQQESCQYIDVGAAFYAFVEGDAGKRAWMKTYANQLSNAINRLNLPKKITRLYAPDKASRSYQLIELAKANGVHQAQQFTEDAKISLQQTGFIENKLYNFNRLSNYLDLSERVNRHANGGPVVSLLEDAAHLAMALPPCRHVVAVNSGTSALYIAAAVNQVLSGNRASKWLTSEFSFFSAGCGMLGNSIVAPCDHEGRLNLKALVQIPVNAYDGIVYTNVFAQHSNWSDIFAWCKANGKSLIIDNATGLLDRPDINLNENAPIEVISCHHTKPWGVGEGGLLICNEEEAGLARKLANFGAGLPERYSDMASLGANYKLSDLAAAAILCRLESIDGWELFYKSQERRVKSLIVDSELPLTPLYGQTQPRSPRAFTPFISKTPVSLIGNGERTLCRKYYKPVMSDKLKYFGDTSASELYQHIVCISNNPFNRNLSNECYLALLNSSLSFQKC